jgi:PAS domain S-box-containing protein
MVRVHTRSKTFRTWLNRIERIPPGPRSYALAISALMLTTAIFAILLNTVGRRASLVYVLLFDVLIMAASWLGYGPGLLVCTLCTFVIPKLLLPNRPLHPDLGRFAMLVMISLLISTISRSKRKTETALRRNAEELEERVKQRTLDLQRSDHTLREQARLLDLAQDAILAKDGDGVIRYWSRGAERMYGWTSEEALGHVCHELLKTAFPEPLAAIHVKLQDGGSWQGEVVQKRRDGGELNATTHWTLWPSPNGGPPGSLEINADVTDRRRVEEQLRHTQKMESIGLLAGGVAHDFNNLLTVISGYAEMALNDVDSGSQAYESLVEIRAAGERAAALTQQLLAFSRKQLLQPTVVNVNQVVTEIRKMLTRLIGENIKIVTRLDPKLGNVVADAGQLQQIVVNLAVNARDAMTEGGTLLIETAEVEFDETYQHTHPEVRLGPHIMLAVTDSGTGMTREVRERLFEPFFTTKPKGSGTGLGLSVVYGMVKQAGGWIWVYSEPGSGTVFKLYFPRTSAKITAATVAPDTDLSGGGTILVVEDQAEVRHLAVAALERYGYTVLEASDGESALQLSDRHAGPIDLLVTDVIMPGMTGCDLASRLAEKRPETRALFVSGYTESTILKRGVLKNEIAFLQKPFTPQTLARKVRSLMDEHRSVRDQSAANGS